MVGPYGMIVWTKSDLSQALTVLKDQIMLANGHPVANLANVDR